ncbi:MAG: YggS family pyridoxal phosphate-dependent enzyme [Planctomycetia bacterium]|nr:YggS family pyridoxal phosphate-dependent enzyme [Planctomycetia bacterium]
MTDLAQIVGDNLARVRERIANAAARCGRSPDEIRLVAVTKYVDAALAQAVVAAGCHDLGESRPQELWSKAAAMPGDGIRWHLIGHLQRNKVRRTLQVAGLIHSLDSLRLAEAIQADAAANVLLEVNISGDESKQGLAPDEVASLLPQLAELDRIQVRGLMTMSHREGGLDVAQADFARLRELRDRLVCELPPSVSLDELSMGMSDDFEAAVLEGSTIVRVGSALFEGLDATSSH